MSNRYAELLAQVPRGSFYEAVGTILPAQRGSPTHPRPVEVTLKPVAANTTFQVYVNQAFMGTGTSGGLTSFGYAILRVLLPLEIGKDPLTDNGRADVIFRQLGPGGAPVTGPGTGRADFLSFLTFRNYATAMAAEADVLGTLDANLDAIEAALSLETANPPYLADVYGAQVGQADALETANWTSEVYRRLVRRLRQAYRLWGSKYRGVRQGVHGFTGSLPLRVPRVWRSQWVLGQQLLPNGEMQQRARPVALPPAPAPTSRVLVDPLPNLNLAATSWVHLPFGGLATLFPAPFRAPPHGAEALTVTFSAGWNGGNVIVTGADATGLIVSDTFVPPGSLPATVTGQLGTEFVLVTLASKGAGAVGTAALGLATTRFVRMVLDGNGNALPGLPVTAGGAVTLVFTAPGNTQDTLRIAQVGALLQGDRQDVSPGAFPRTPTQGPSGGELLPTVFELEAPSLRPYAVLYGQRHVSASFVLTTDTRYLGLEVEQRGVVLVDLGTSSPISIFNGLNGVVDRINAAFLNDGRYGALYVPTAFDDLDSNTQFQHALRFQAAGGGSAPAEMDSSVHVHPVGADASSVIFGLPLTQATLNFGTPARTRDLAETFTGLAPAGAFPTVDETVRLLPALGGVAPDDAILAPFTLGIAQPVRPTTLELYFRADWRAAGLAVYATAFGGAAVELDFAGPNVFVSEGFSATSTDGVHVVLAAPGDTFAGVNIGDFYQRQGSLGGAWGYVVAVAAQTLTLSSSVGVFATSELWAVFRPANKAASGLHATGTGGTTVTLGGGETFAGVAPGMFFRHVDAPDTGAFVRFGPTAAAPGTLTLAATLSAFADRPWVITRDFLDTTPVLSGPGAQAQGVVSALIQVAPMFVPPPGAGQGIVHVLTLGGAGAGYDVRVGRGMRQFAAGPATITASAGGTEATFSAGSLVSELTDLGGTVLLAGSTTSTNDGLHTIIAFAGTGPGDTSVVLRHQLAGTGPAGTFTTEALPGGGSWRLYTLGEVVRAVAAGLVTGTPTLGLYPPGLAQSWTSGALLELASEMPTEARGVPGLPALEVEVDRLLAPTAGTTDTLTVSGSTTGGAMPDGWFATQQDATTPAGAIDIGALAPTRLQLVGSASGTTQTLYRDLPTQVVRAFRGFKLETTFWAQQHITAAPQTLGLDYSFDAGATWTSVATAAVAGTWAHEGAVAPFAPAPGPSLPAVLRGSLVVPAAAVSLRVRLTAPNPAISPPPLISVERATVVALPLGAGGGLFLGHGTVAFGASREAFGEVLYVWSPEPLDAVEARAIGLPPQGTLLSQPDPTDKSSSHIDRLVDAHGVWDRYDVSEYGAPVGGGLPPPVNTLGAYGGTLGWLAPGVLLKNMDLAAIGSPDRLNVLRAVPAVLLSGPTAALPSQASLSAPVGPQGTVTLLDPGVTTAANLLGQRIRITNAQASENNIEAIITQIGPSQFGYANPQGVPESPFTGAYDIVSAHSVSLHENERLALTSPSNATLSETSAHEGPFPEAPFPDEQLFEDGLSVPASPLLVPLTRTASGATLSAPDANGFVTLTDALGLPAAAVNRSLKIAGLTASGGVNNSPQGAPFLVIDQQSPTTLRFFHLAGVGETFGAGASYTVTNDGVLPWRFLAPNKMQLASVPAGDPADQAILNNAAGVVYTLSYRRLLRATTAAIVLPAGATDYLWLVDASIYQRTEPGSAPYRQTEQLVFAGNRQATLSTTSDQDATQATLVASNGTTILTLAQGDWQYVNNQTVQIAPASFDPTAVYNFTYNALEPTYLRPAQYVLEARAAVDAATLATASWVAVQEDDLVDATLNYHQLRVTLTTVTDPRDFEIAGLGLRGLHLYGAGAHTPGIG